MLKFLLTVILWCILLVLCWPLALIVGLLWLILLPFSLLGWGFAAIFKLLTTLIRLPFEMVRSVTK